MVFVSWTASTDQRYRPPERLPFMGRSVLDDWESKPADVRERCLGAVVDKLPSHGGCFLIRVIPWGTRYSARGGQCSVS